MSQEYVYVKLLNGEQLMATKIDEDLETITIQYPMLIRMFPRLDESGLVEQITSGPYCQFTEDRIFTFFKKDVLFFKRLHELMIPHYERMLDEHEREVDVDIDQALEGNLETDETVENLSKAVDHIHSIFERARRQKEEEEAAEKVKHFIQGNDTKH
jgi:hypothetical protein